MDLKRPRCPVAIRSIAYSFPRRRISNAEPPYSEIPDLPPSWHELWGCDNRAWFDPDKGETLESLLVPTALQALDLAGVRPGELDLVMGNTSAVIFRDRQGWSLIPRIGMRIRRAIGADRALAWDVEQECMSNLAAIQIAANRIREGTARAALVCSAENATSVMDFTEPTATIFGDGVAAIVLVRGEGEEDLLSAAYETNSQLYDLATVHWRYPKKMPPDKRRPEDFWTYFTLRDDTPEQMQLFIPEVVPRMVNKALGKISLAPDDIDFFAFHQPSQVLVGLWAANIGVPPEKFLLTMQRYGCLISASWPITLHHGFAEGRIRPGSRVVIAAAATGWSYGAQVWRVGDVRVKPEPAYPPASPTHSESPP